MKIATFLILCFFLPICGEVFQQSSCNFKPLFHITAVYLMNDEEEFLLLHRQDQKSEGNKWGIPGGKINSRETPLQAVIRETKEETGFDISNQPIEDLGMVYVEHDAKIHFTYHMFRTKLQDDPGTVKINYEEHKGFTWVKPSDALKMDLLRDEDPCIRLIYPQ